MKIQAVEMISVLMGDCLKHLKDISDESVDLVYLDPPFFTQKIQRLSTREGNQSFLFSDLWASHHEYAEFLNDRLLELHRVLKKTGSIFFHCDRSASHIVRILLDKIFGEENFQSEIIWSYRRWSNSKKGLMPSHQTIFFYSRTEDFKFHMVFTDYSPTTNVDQIIQKRGRDKRGKAVYARDETGEIISNGSKKGVPLNDVWEIPYLNPKACERVGYPTQKPILLLERIIELVTNEGDLILDPFCGSGTTLIAAHFLRRRAIGIDHSPEAVKLTQERLKAPIKSESHLLREGKDTYINKDNNVGHYLPDIDFVPVHRNKGIDAILKKEIGGNPVFIRVQQHGELLKDAVSALWKASRKKGPAILVVIAIKEELEDELFENNNMYGIIVVNSTSLEINKSLKDISNIP